MPNQPPTPPEVKLRKSENKLFTSEELLYGDKSSESKYINFKNILESIPLDASKLDLSEA